MEELVRCNDPVLLSAVEALLGAAGIGALVVGENMAVLEGSIGIFSRRLLVGRDDAPRARRLLIEAGFGSELRPEGA